MTVIYGIFGILPKKEKKDCSKTTLPLIAWKNSLLPRTEIKSNLSLNLSFSTTIMTIMKNNIEISPFVQNNSGHMTDFVGKYKRIHGYRGFSNHPDDCNRVLLERLSSKTFWENVPGADFHPNCFSISPSYWWILFLTGCATSCVAWKGCLTYLLFPFLQWEFFRLAQILLKFFTEDRKRM